MSKTESISNLTKWSGKPFHLRDSKNMPKDWGMYNNELSDYSINNQQTSVISKNPDLTKPTKSKKAVCKDKKISTLKDSPCHRCDKQKECFVWGVLYADVGAVMSENYEEPNLSSYTSNEIIEAIGRRYEIMQLRIDRSQVREDKKASAFNKACSSSVARTFKIIPRSAKRNKHLDYKNVAGIPIDIGDSDSFKPNNAIADVEHINGKFLENTTKNLNVVIGGVNQGVLVAIRIGSNQMAPNWQKNKQK